jgi:rhodanese-related sulfurtransferase
MTQQISASELKTLCQEGGRLQLIDVRSPTEFAAGHIPTAINLPLEQLDSRLADLDRSRSLILTCQRGPRSVMAQKRLQTTFPGTPTLLGGTEAWREAGLPIVSTARSRWSLERQVRLGAGLIVVIGIVLSLMVNRNWIGLSAFAGLGLTFAGFTDICPMGMLLARMPWNRQSTPTAHETSCVEKG